MSLDLDSPNACVYYTNEMKPSPWPLLEALLFDQATSEEDSFPQVANNSSDNREQHEETPQPCLCCPCWRKFKARIIANRY